MAFTARKGAGHTGPHCRRVGSPGIGLRILGAFTVFRAFTVLIAFRATRPIRATLLTLLAVSALTGLTALTPALAEAGQGGARLSRDLAAHLASGSTEPVQVILQGGEIRVQELASRYNLEIKRLLSSGGVIEVNAGQLDALSRDPEVGQLAADAVVQPTLAVTTQSTGAEQAWAGLDGIGRVTGRGIGIAVIDSGIAPLLPSKETVGTKSSNLSCYPP